MLHLETSTVLFQHTLCFLSQYWKHVEVAKKKNLCFEQENYRKVTSGSRNQKTWTSRVVVRDCRSHFCVWLPVRYFNHNSTNNFIPVVSAKATFSSFPLLTTCFIPRVPFLPCAGTSVCVAMQWTHQGLWSRLKLLSFCPSPCWLL